MKITVHLSAKEANRNIEDEVSEDIRKAYVFIFRAIEDVCAKYQIRTREIEIDDRWDREE